MSSASAVVLSNNLLFRAKRDNVSVSPMKLQKLLYYVCVKYAKETGTLPISEQFEVWKTGSVLVSVHSVFQPFGSRPISAYAMNAKGQTKVVDEECNPILRRCLDYTGETNPAERFWLVLRLSRRAGHHPFRRNNCRYIIVVVERRCLYAHFVYY